MPKPNRYSSPYGRPPTPSAHHGGAIRFEQETTTLDLTGVERALKIVERNMRELFKSRANFVAYDDLGRPVSETTVNHGIKDAKRTRREQARRDREQRLAMRQHYGEPW
ncbi:MAG: hypothetical protein ACXWP0_12110 [Ktedonobacterales bacterium]